MIFEHWLLPDIMFPSFRDVTPEALREAGIRFIFSDIDNTLATYDDPEPPDNVTAWIRAMEEAGIRVIFVSNNDASRVERFAAPLGCPAYPKARKPLIGVLRQAMEDAGADPDESLLLGDQLLTDCAAGRRAGMRVYIVPPIKDKTTLFFRAKRLIERPYVREYEKRRTARSLGNEATKG
ncbi:MAG: YqeG family HAD IIIA-type phosphatase [Clostridia bacterium]|nr:YqeG family HAD IIIA-type phosphatase [Clostridia bacterium]